MSKKYIFKKHYNFLDEIRKADIEFQENIERTKENLSLDSFKQATKPLEFPAYLLGCMASYCDISGLDGDIVYSPVHYAEARPLWESLSDPIKTVSIQKRNLTEEGRLYRSLEEILEEILEDTKDITKNSERAYRAFQKVSDETGFAKADDVIDYGYEVALLQFEMFENGESIRIVHPGIQGLEPEEGIVHHAVDPNGLFELIANTVDYRNMFDKRVFKSRPEPTGVGRLSKKLGGLFGR